MFLDKYVPRDKQYHLAAGFGISVVGILIFKAAVAGIVLAILGGVAKEVYDKVSGKGTADPIDAVFTAIGGLVPTIVATFLV